MAFPPRIFHGAIDSDAKCHFSSQYTSLRMLIPIYEPCTFAGVTETFSIIFTSFTVVYALHRNPAIMKTFLNKYNLLRIMRSRLLVVVVVLISIAMIINMVPLATSSHNPHQSRVYGGASPKTKAINNLPSSISILNELQRLPFQLYSKVSPEDSMTQNLQPSGSSLSSGFASEQ